MDLLYKFFIFSFFLNACLSLNTEDEDISEGRHSSGYKCDNPPGKKGDRFVDDCKVYKCSKNCTGDWHWKKVRVPQWKACCLMNGNFYMPNTVMQTYYYDGCPLFQLSCDENLNTATLINPYPGECICPTTIQPTTSTMMTSTSTCPPIICDANAETLYSNTYPCGYCKCLPGWVGPGYLCGPDDDSDGWSDIALNCNETSCTQDNCVGIPNSGQEDSDSDGEGDACDFDSDNDGIDDSFDNCPTIPNANQANSDNDPLGDACDNCINDNNEFQEDADNDGIGDVCDDDIDNDGIINLADNCPVIYNPNQVDIDNDTIGDDCDNCKDIYNPLQEDDNSNLIGDACEDSNDKDNDGIPDANDNCPEDANADQLDSDQDGLGDECDDDKDNDGKSDSKDNCPFVPNSDQADDDNDGVGNACQDDCDGDQVSDEFDACPCNKEIEKTDFRGIQTVCLGGSQEPPIWEFLDDGKEILQKKNSAAGVAIGSAKLARVEFEGTIYVSDNSDDDMVGAVFAYQDSSNFYVLMSSREGSNQGPWQIKRVNSETGPCHDAVDGGCGSCGSTDLSNAIYYDYNVTGQTEVLWRYPTTKKRLTLHNDPTHDEP